MKLHPITDAAMKALFDERYGGSAFNKVHLRELMFGKSSNIDYAWVKAEIEAGRLREIVLNDLKREAEIVARIVLNKIDEQRPVYDVAFNVARGDVDQCNNTVMPALAGAITQVMKEMGL